MAWNTHFVRIALPSRRNAQFMSSRTYIAIDLKSFYASVECLERGLDPLTTNLVVADESRTQKTICLAVSPSLKSYGISGRARLFEVARKIREENERRRRKAPNYAFSSESYDSTVLQNRPDTAIAYLVATPRMALYIKRSALIYSVYLKYIAPEDIHVYSIDEVFIDATSYIGLYKKTAHELAMTIMRDVFKTTGITATAGIGDNLYLCKAAMDIVAKRMPPDKDGVRIAELDEMSYRRLLWEHRPLTDFWRVGKGYAKKLEAYGLRTMGDIARCSLHCEDLLYRLFGVNAELLIDHAWGWEPCGIADIKAYRPASSSICSGQVLHEAYGFEKARLVVREMTDALALELLNKRLVTNQLVLTVGYDSSNLTDAKKDCEYHGQISTDRYGRMTPKHAHGTMNLKGHTSSASLLGAAVVDLFERIVNRGLLVRRVTLSANNVIEEKYGQAPARMEQLSLLTDASSQARREEQGALQRERRRQQAVLAIRNRYGKNAILKGMSFQDGATAMERNRQIGGHKA